MFYVLIVRLSAKDLADSGPDWDTRYAYKQGRHKGKGGWGQSSLQLAPRDMVRGLAF